MTVNQRLLIKSSRFYNDRELATTNCSDKYITNCNNAVYEKILMFLSSDSHISVL